MSDSLRPHGLQHARLPCPSLLSEFAPITWPPVNTQSLRVLPPLPSPLIEVWVKSGGSCVLMALEVGMGGSPDL